MSTKISPARPRNIAHISASGILHAEWLKLFTLRSTWWCLAILVVFTITLPLLITAVSYVDPEINSSAQLAYSSWMGMSTFAINLAMLAAATLGALTITGEYGTGMIRSSMTAAPRRLSTLWAKALVIGAVFLVVSLVALIIGALGSGVILNTKGYPIDFGDTRAWLTLLNTSLYPALIAVFALGLGALIRNSAGTISTVMGLLLVVPNIIQLIGMILDARWMLDLFALLPSSLGSSMQNPVGAPDPQAGLLPNMLTLEPWQATLGLLAWVVCAMLCGALVIKRRDV